MNTKLSFLLIPFVLACFACLPGAQAVPDKTPAAPETVLTGFNTADGDHALSLTTGVVNVANGWYSLFSNTDGSYNTVVGAGTLVFNIGDQGTFQGIQNTAIGAAALLFNTTGLSNTAVGARALLNNTEGFDNTATGIAALSPNTDGFDNTAAGAGALDLNSTGSGTKLGYVPSSCRYKEDIRSMDKASEALFAPGRSPSATRRELIPGKCRPLASSPRRWKR